MPTIAHAHFAIDLQTLFAVVVFLSATGALLLLFCWMQNRNTPALAFWGSGYLLGAVAAAMLGSGGAGNALVICISNALLCGAYGVMWGGSRSFEGRRVRAPLIAAGGAIWIVAFQLESFRASPASCVVLVSFIQAAYALLSARELWYARDRELISRWPTLALVVGHAGFLLARIPFATVVASSAAAGQPRSAIVLVMAAEALFVNFCLPFLRVAMSKERSELEQRKAALTDSLTGVAKPARLLRSGRAIARAHDGRPAPGGAAPVRSRPLQGGQRHCWARSRGCPAAGVCKARRRIGAARRPVQPRRRRGIRLPPHVSMEEALQIAERLRAAFGLMRFPGVAASTTVSVGIAMTTSACRTLPALMATADRALYRAKAEGRNRVAPAPLVVLETGANAARAALDIGAAAPLAAPMAS